MDGALTRIKQGRRNRKEPLYGIMFPIILYLQLPCTNVTTHASLPVCNVITRQHAGGARSGRRCNCATWPHTFEKMRDNAGAKIAETSIAVRQGVRRGAAAEQLRFQIGCKPRADASIVSNGTMHS